MTNVKTLATDFAPAERAVQDEIERQASYFSDFEVVGTFLASVPLSVLVLNKERQVVFANQHALQAFELTDLSEALGKRPGELLHCQHAYETPGGCGTTAFCRYCGAAQAILASQEGAAAVQECRILPNDAMNAMDLRVWATPFRLHDEGFTIFSIADISDEKRRHALESIFFHDVLNSASLLRGAVEFLPEVEGETREELEHMLCSITDRLIEEIQAQRDLVAAENGELSLHIEPISALEILREQAATYTMHEVAQGRRICIDPHASDVTLLSDKRLLNRIIGNLVKNALEAVQAEQAVMLTCCAEGDFVEFEVHNPTVMSQAAQHQVFQRSFSTKGAGRGLGTYSIKLLTERYLGGRISFVSTDGEGTTFRVAFPIQLNA